MKYLLFTFIALLGNQVLFAQSSYKRTTLEILDEVEKECKKIGGKSAYVKFSLLKSTISQNSETEAETFVSVQIKNRETTTVLHSSGSAISTNLGLSVGNQNVSRVNHENENIILSKQDLEQLTAFLSETIQYTLNAPSHDTGWSLEINDRFKLSFLYEQKSTDKWKYYMELENAKFKIPFEEGTTLMKKLFEFKDLAD